MSVRFALLALLVGVGLAAPVEASQRYAAFVADAETGEVLHARRADAPRYPASLTKMMTLYMVFEAIEQGELALDDEITASREAASRPESKLGLREGDRLPVETAIRALVVRSANDVAVAVAEHLAGSEAEFAEAMTTRAAALGLEATTFKNASGLPNRNQRTTARDMAALAVALKRDFPEHFHVFDDQSVSWRGRRFTSHNTLVGRVDGVDGLKTGYIRASGFNVAVSAERDDRRIVTVVMGGATASVRDAHAEELVDAAFAALDARETGMALASLDAPRLNPIREQELLTAELSGLAGPTAMGSSAGAAPAQIAFDDPARHAAGWSVQVGAFSSQAAAEARLESIAALDTPELAAARAMTARVDAAGRALWRARFTALDQDAARSACRRLSERGETCVALSPDA